MAARPVGVLLVLCLSATASSPKSSDVITWPPEYHFKVEVLDLETTLKSSIEIWYSSRFNRSCIENYGIKKTYYAPNAFPHMVQFITNQEGKDEIVCMQYSFGDIHTYAMNFLPDALAFENSGESTYLDGRRLDIWIAKEHVHEDWWISEIIYVANNLEGVHIPVRQVYKLYNLLNGSILKHQISKYYDFMDNITEQDITLGDVNSCKPITEYIQHPKDHFTFMHPEVPSDLNTAFGRFKNIHKNKYDKKEHVIRKKIFEKNWRMIIAHNHKNLTYKLSINQFADKTEEELNYLSINPPLDHARLLAEPFPYSIEESDEIVKQLPTNFDLRMEGVIGIVKTQGDCQSCWAFAITAAVEGVLARRLEGSRLLDLSEQSLIDCSWQYGNLGCHGGYIATTMHYATENGIPIESDYPYKDGDDYCKIKNVPSVHKIRGYVLVTPGNPNAMKVAIYKHGPVVVTIRGGPLWTYYDQGIYKSERLYSSCSNFSYTHTVALVGYGERNGEEYWIGKNSYGQGWGQDGYILLSAAIGNCFLTLDEPYYPVL